MTTSRRMFLQNTSLAVAGASLASGLSLARSAHGAESSEKIKVGLIGAGGRGRGAAMNSINSCPNTELVAICDAFEDNAKNTLDLLKKQLEKNKQGDRINVPEERIFSGFDGYQKVIDSGVDMVLIATPPGFRPIHYKAAVEAGKHIFMEKPVCVDAPGYRTVMEVNKLADKKNLKVGVGLQRHHQANYLELIKRIKDGAIGDLQYLTVYWNSRGVWNRKREPQQTEMEYQMRNWYYFVWLCGDHIAEQHIHNMDVGNWLMESYPVKANGMGGREVRKFGSEGDFGHIFDHHAVEFTYADGRKMFSQCRHIPKTWSQVNEFAYGTKGYANFDKGIIYTGDDKWDYKRFAKGQKKVSPYDQEHIDLMDAIFNDKPYNEGYNGAKSSFTAILGRMATYSGKEVNWDDAIAKGPSESPEKYAWDAKPPVLPDDKGSYEHAVAVPGVYKPY